MGLGDRFKKIFGQGKKEDKNDDHAEEFKREFEMPKTELSSDDILFVCSSDTIISPMAKAIFNGKETDKKAFSAGIMASEGRKPAANVIEVCLNHGIDLRTFESANIANFKLNDSCLVLTSSVSVRDFLKDVYPDYQIFTINEYAGFSNPDIEDPSGSDLDAFEECFCEIENAIDEIIGVDKKVSDEEHTDFCDEIVEEIPIKDSSYISSLIDGGSKFIELDCDIKGSFNIDVDDVVIEGNGRTVDLERNRCNITGNNITIKNLTFTNGFGEGYNGEGGAIFNNGSLTLIKCKFTDNHVKEVQAGAIANFDSLTCIDCEFYNNTSRGDCYTKGGAIWNKGSLTLKNCILKNNAAEKCGGAIHNDDGLLNIENCTFENNAVNDGFFVVGNGGAISNLGKINCFKSTFSGNESNNGSSIFNCDELTIVNSTLGGTGSNSNIHQINEDSVINIENSVFYGKTYIENGLCTVKRSDFNGFSIHNENATLKIIIEEEDNDPNIESIYNNGILKILENSGIEDIVEAGENSVIEYIAEKLDSEWKGFDYLNALIESGECELSLDCDIALHESEQNFYEGGIEISKDNFTIDGNGHVIDASGMSRIFYITAKDVTLKNIVFKNGKYFKSFFDDETNGGGAIFVCHESSLKVEGCEFMDNISKKSAGVINTKGDSLDIIKSTFDNNSCENDGGCIFSISDMTIDGCSFKNNRASKYHGGVISSTNRLMLSDSSFCSNEGCYGGVIYDRGFISIENCSFTDNYATNDGGVINAAEISKIDNCIFKNNSSRFTGGVIESESISLLKNSVFESNSGSDGGAIYNKSQLSIEKCIFKLNYCEHSPGGAIHNSGSLNVDGCDFENNSSKFSGGAILTQFGTEGSHITNCNFRNNRSDEGSAIYSLDDNLNIKNCCFMGNWRNMVCNYGFLNLRDCQFEEAQIIFNHKTLKIPYSQKDSLAGRIENEGDINIDFDEAVIDKKGFYYLYNMIESSKSLTVRLENNFIFNADDLNSPIPLRKDGLTIDGNGHHVVSSGSNVFKIIGDGITLKNIKFVSSNPIIQDGNGALNIEDCSFDGCRLSGLNRASFANCCFSSAHVGNDSGVLNFSECAFDGCYWSNTGNLNLNKCNFSHSVDTSIFNDGKCFIRHCTYQDFSQIRNLGEIFILDSERELADYVKGNDVKLMLDRGDYNNFSYLNYLVHESDEIVLSEDIVFDKNHDDSGYVIIDRDDLVIDGRGHSIDASDYKGIFRIIGFNVTLKNIVFLNANKSAIVNESDVKVIDCSFKNNISNHNGSAIQNSGNLTAVNCYFENNSSTWKYADGGAINNEGSAFLKGCLFISNHSQYSGGAIYTSGEMHLNSCVFKQNNSQIGGAIRSYGGRTHLTDCLFEDNSASTGAGLYIYGSDGQFSLTFSRFLSNVSKIGGCIYMNTDHEMAEISECSFKDNSAVRGGVIFNNDDSSLTIEKSTFESNRADNEGGVIYGGRLNVSSSRFCENISGGYGNALYNTHDSAFRFCEFSSTQESAFIFNSACLILESCDFKSPGSDIIINTNNLKIEKTGFEKHHKIV